MELTNATDLILLHRWRASRDAEAFRALAERYAGLVFAAAHRVLRDPSEAEDVAQECFLTLAQARKPPERNLGAWLHAAAVNRAKNHIRGEVRRRQREQHYNALKPDHIQTDLDDTLAHVDEAIAALDDELRHVIIAHFLEAKSQGEIADTSGVSRQTVNARVKRGVEAIREHLTKKGITTTTASLTALLGSQMVEAAPAALVAALGKVALSGGAIATGGGVVASLAGLLTTKVATVLAAILLAVLSLITYQEVVSRSLTNTEPEALHRSVEVSEGGRAAESIPPVAETVRASAEVLSESAVIANGGGLLAGTILDENGDLMMRHVTVQAYADHPPDLKMDWDSSAGQRYAEDNLVRQRETSSGEFELDAYLQQGATGTIYAIDGERNVESDHVPFDLSKGDLKDITLRFRPYGSIAGTLLDRQGIPISGAKVEFISASGGSIESGSDEMGQFSIAPLPPGPYEVLRINFGDLYSPEQNHVELRVSNSNVVVGDGEHVDSVAVVCDCELTHVSGRVVDEEGAGIPNLRLLLKDAGIDLARPVRVNRLFGVTDARGEFDLSVYGPGIYKLDLVSPDYELPEPVNVRSGEVDLELHARVGGKKTLRFHVVDGRTGEHVDSYVSAHIEGRNSGQWHSESGGPLVTTISVEEATGAVATFASEEVGVATYPIKLSDLGGPEILIRLQPVAPIEGQVLDSEGNPKANVRIHNTPVSGWEPRTRTDEEGRFQLIDLSPSQTTVYLFTDDAPQMQVPIARDGKWVIRLPRGSTISGVATANGKPMKGLELELCSRATDVHGEVRRKATTDDEGHYEFRGVASGTATLLASAPAEMEGVILGAMQQEVKVVPDKTARVDFVLDIRTADASLRGMMYAGGLPVNGGVGVQRADGNRNGGTFSEPFNAAEGYRIANLSSGDVVISASRGRGWKTIPHRLTPGENTLDIQFSKGGATLNCTFPIPPDNVSYVHNQISVDTEFGEETIFDTRIPITQSGIRIDDLPEGTASIRFEILEKGSQHVKNFERTVELVSGSITSVNFGGDRASLSVSISGVQDSEQIVIHLLPGRPALPDIQSMSPADFAEHLSNLQPTATLEKDDLDQPIQDLDAGVYTIFGFAVPVQGVVAVTEGLPPGLRTVQAEVTLEPETEAQVTLAFP